MQYLIAVALCLQSDNTFIIQPQSSSDRDWETGGANAIGGGGGGAGGA